MPTDWENRELARIEHQLADDDPRLARLLGASPEWHRARHARHVLECALAAMLGLIVLTIVLAAAA